MWTTHSSPGSALRDWPGRGTELGRHASRVLYLRFLTDPDIEGTRICIRYQVGTDLFQLIVVMMLQVIQS